MARKKKKEKYLNYLVLFALLVLVSVLAFFNIKLWNERKITKEQLQRIETDLLRIEEEAEMLKTEEDVDIEEKIERVAREQLLLKKEGESVIVISREEELLIEKEEEEEEEKGFFESLMDIFQTE
jgi:cell division protein FtsB